MQLGFMDASKDLSEFMDASKDLSEFMGGFQRFK
jgi:hypothetical protein